MRHRNKVKKFGRDKAHKEAMIRNLLASLVLHEKIKTTKSKAKVLSQEFEKLMTRVKKQDDKNQVRELKRVLYSEEAGKKVREDLVKRYADRPSGLTRLTKLFHRKGDNAPVVLIELV